MHVSEADWKLFKRLIPIWQEAYMEKLTREYMSILQGDEDASEKFWKLEKRIRDDKNSPGVLIKLSKSTMVYDIAKLINDGVIEFDDLKEFSEEVVSMIVH